MRRDHRLGWAIAAVAASALFMTWWLHWFDLVDLQVYRAGASAFLHGRDIYKAHAPGSPLPFTYPPFAAVAFSPLTIPDTAARVVMSVVSAGCLVWAMLSLLPAGVRSRWAIALAVCAAVPLFEPLRDTFRLGQVNLILMAMVLADLRRGRGVLLGLATAIKLTPGIFIIYLLATRRFRHAAVASATALGASVVAWALMPSASVHFWAHLVVDDKRIGSPGNVWNQSLRGVLARVTGTPDAAHLVWVAAAAAVLVGGMVLAARFHGAGDDLTGVAVAALTGLLVSPISWNHHWVWALPAAVALWRRAGAAAAGLWAAVFALASITWWTFAGHDDYALTAGQQIEGACYVLAAAVLLVTWATTSRAAATRAVA